MFDPRFGSKPPFAVVVAETTTDASGADRRTSAGWAEWTRDDGGEGNSLDRLGGRDLLLGVVVRMVDHLARAVVAKPKQWRAIILRVNLVGRGTSGLTGRPSRWVLLLSVSSFSLRGKGWAASVGAWLQQTLPVPASLVSTV
jgi:hypothetical protein